MDVFDGLDLMPIQTAVLARDGSIIFANRSWYEFAEQNDYHGPDFLTVNYLHLCQAVEGAEQVDAQRFAAGLHSVLTGTCARFEMVYPCHAPDRKRWFKAIAVARQQWTLVSHFDLTRELERFEKIASAYRKSSAVHELKTPLNSIIGFSELGLQAFERPEQFERSGQTVDLADCLKTINTASREMLETVTDSLDSAPQTEVINRTVDEDIEVAALLGEIGRQQGPLAKRAGVELHLPQCTSCSVRGERSKLRKVFANLLSNAIKYSERGGRVEASCHHNVAGGIEVRIADIGIGIPPDKLDTIFEPFVRVVDQDGVRRREGSGVGLSVANAFVEAHEGQIRVDSTLGKGSVFTVLFPGWRTVRAR